MIYIAKNLLSDTWKGIPWALRCFKAFESLRISGSSPASPTTRAHRGRGPLRKLHRSWLTSSVIGSSKLKANLVVSSVYMRYVFLLFPFFAVRRTDVDVCPPPRISSTGKSILQKSSNLSELERVRSSTIDPKDLRN